METNDDLPSRVLFLDIDGVLNSRRSAVATGGYPHGFDDSEMVRFDLIAIALVRKLCREAKAKIVLSSTWRYHFPIWKIAEELDLPIVGCTPRPSECDYMNRGQEIAQWLAEHPAATRYAIVDDINAMLPEQQQYFVQTNEEFGLSLADYERLLTILKN